MDRELPTHSVEAYICSPSLSFSLGIKLVFLSLFFASTNVEGSQHYNDLSSHRTDWIPDHVFGIDRVRRGGAGAAAGKSSPDQSSSSNDRVVRPLRVAYQGEPGAYSEKATRELLGSKVVAVGHPSFESCFRAVASMECDYACLPIENSLGGSIHDNYDLMLRYDLTIVAEHEFRVHHCLLVKQGVQKNDIKYAISHPQALAQCDNYLRNLGITPIATYDTAGSAKMIAENGPKLPEGCTPDNTAAIASDLAGRTYGLHCLAERIEDDDSNFTRFLLLSRNDVVQYLTKKIPAKTSVVFTLPNTPGALYKALACFSLRDIDFSKIESRPTSASLLNFLKFRSQQNGGSSRMQDELPRFRYCFYLDFLANQLDENAQNALAHLREQSDFMRILGSYPKKSRLVGPVKDAVEQLKQMVVTDPTEISLTSTNAGDTTATPLSIGIVGFDQFGQYLAKHLVRKHRVSCMDRTDKVRTTDLLACLSRTSIKSYFLPPKLNREYCYAMVLLVQSLEAQKLGVEYHPTFDTSRFFADLDVIILAVPLISLEETIQSLPVHELKGKLIVEMGVLNQLPKQVMLQAFAEYPDIDILATHAMFRMSGVNDDNDGGDSNSQLSATWDNRPVIYEKVRISNYARLESFLKIFEDARCRMVEMNSEQHDGTVADAEFVTHLVGRLLSEKQLLPPTPVRSKEYSALRDVADMTSNDSFDLFFGMFKYNPRARDHLNKMRDNLASMERQLVAKESYLAASSEIRSNDRQRLLAETKLLLQEVVGNTNRGQEFMNHHNMDTNNAASVVSNDGKIPPANNSTKTMKANKP
jgi:prephenate dehydratase/prephenate dehydrogenase